MAHSYAALACVILMGTLPPEVDGSASDQFDEGGLTVADDPMVTTELTRAGGPNGTTTQKLETGAIVSIVMGGTAVLILLVGVVWWYTMRNRSVRVEPASSVRQQGFLAFGQSAECDTQAEIPLLRLSIQTNGAK